MAAVALFHGAVPPPPPVFYLNAPPKARNNSHFHSLQFHRHLSYRCTRRGASSSSSSSWATDFDLYDLLGVDRCSDQFEIKKAYRALQKRCHPDIAGPAGHDMAILLNEIYSVLSDPIARGAYDHEQAKLSEFQGYTGKPVYSTWFGPEDEERAVFVDELKCVGCLKCALFASKTFAIESAYGRARVVGQWADPEERILDAVKTCPVDCISFVERSNLAALEFLMSKQPRGSVRISAGNAVGTRVSNIFAEVTKFQNRYRQMKEKASREESKVHDLRRESRSWAIRGIRSISNWWYWRPPSAATVEAETYLTLIPTRSTIPSTDRLQEAAARHKTKGMAGLKGKTSTSSEHGDDYYWTPITFLPPPSTTTPSTLELFSGDVSESKDEEVRSAAAINKRSRSAKDLMGPVMMAVVSAAAVGSKGTEMGGGLKEHIAGSTALGVVNSFELQMLLAGVTWFIIGMGIQSLVDAIGSKGVFRR
ncbi:chaperone protein dnaJ C76, chloroplastic-like [Musa acuminata AAA Group]|uniref:chaperone protein dnaJ C76, chloroplastic-like n=1 Tax=Musa acuminata AAA Group TaxID=214697 RepID=UPI0031E3A7E9